MTFNKEQKEYLIKELKKISQEQYNKLNEFNEKAQYYIGKDKMNDLDDEGVSDIPYKGASLLLDFIKKLEGDK